MHLNFPYRRRFSSWPALLVVASGLAFSVAAHSHASVTPTRSPAQRVVDDGTRKVSKAPRQVAAAAGNARKRPAAKTAEARPAARWLEPEGEEAAGTRYQTFFSPTLQQRVSYQAYLPPGYDTVLEQRYPVVYWLHGLNGDQRRGIAFTEKLDLAIKGGLAPAMIVILANGMRDRFYCDSRDGTIPVETVIARDLVAAVDAAHRTVARREARAIEGASMGGFGALYLGFKYPETFGVISSVMAGIHDEDSIAEMYPGAFQAVYGGSREYFRRNSPWTLVEQNAGAIRHRTFIRLWIGGADLDWRQERNARFHGVLERLQLEHEYRVIPGVAHAFLPLYEKMGEANWAFYRRAFAPAR